MKYKLKMTGDIVAFSQAYFGRKTFDTSIFRVKPPFSNL